jgi:predicted dienelactone hydrolase
MRARTLTHRILRSTTWLILGGFATVVLLIIGLLIEDSRTTSLPEPSGSFAVGRVIEDWVDDDGVDKLAPRAGTKRELLVWIWYPTTGTTAPVDDYLPTPLRPEPDPSDARNPWTYLTRDPSLVRGHSRRDADLAPPGRFPIVLFRAGASARTLNYSSLAEDLASHGFVVVGFDAPYRTGLVTFPDGRAFGRRPENDPERCLGLPSADEERCAVRLLDAWVDDMAFVLDRLKSLADSATPNRFTGRLDVSRVGVFGHSFGGAAAAQFCERDPRCRAGVDIDGALHGAVIREGLTRPFMLLLSDHGAEAGPETDRITHNLRSFWDHLPTDSRLWVEIPGSFHFMFSDDGAVMKSAIVRGMLRLIGRLRIDARRQLAATSYCLQTFFETYLKAPPGGRPAIPSPLAPEVRVVR